MATSGSVFLHKVYGGIQGPNDMTYFITSVADIKRLSKKVKWGELTHHLPGVFPGLFLSEVRLHLYHGLVISGASAKAQSCVLDKLCPADAGRAAIPFVMESFPLSCF